MKILTCEQYSPEWWDARMGIPTASRASDIITPKKGELSTSCSRYIAELIAELKGFFEPGFESDWMLRGKEIEPEARRFFEFETGLTAIQVGTAKNDEQTAAASADALIPADGQTLFDELTADEWQVPSNVFAAGLEIKCPKPSTHIGYLMSGTLPEAYKPQVHFSLAVTGLPAWYWMSYHPDVDKLAPMIIRVERDDYTAKVEQALAQFLVLREKAMRKLGID